MLFTQSLFGLLQAFAILGKAHDMRGHYAVDGRNDARAGQATERIDVIIGNQLAGAGMLEISNAELALQRLGRNRPIQRLAGGIAGKGRMRLEHNARLDGHVVHTVGHLLTGRIVGQALILRIEIGWRIYGCGGPGHQLVGPGQIMVAIQRLVNGIGKRRFVARIGTGRIQIFGRTLRERGIQDVLAKLRLLVGTIYRMARTGCQQAHQQGSCQQ